ncbi:peptidase M14 [Cellulophaga baltica]|uniref:M14 family metallopeptidase n=1 Tax=Cellulophaga TaxID=104264 RepID=UPI001C071D8A|nr:MULTISPECIES: M14 metallopeptidase family protein [Cellulophaga]MBU2996182.1 peptidase M14 [Cellulophaga baltica]MDO6767577.1 M14 family metallopeptidase [Cellulophaga sp. 1_MG-2023]
MIRFLDIQKDIKVTEVQGRYVTNEHVFPFLNSLNNKFKVDAIGESVLGKTIKSVTFGSGKHKILMWSQMHGNESTTTKAVLDFINFIDSGTDLANSISTNCTIKIIPILNPDGAEAYTRINANEVDLNRDAQKRTQPESKVLRSVYEEFEPDYCFNLHDQRTIFNVGATPKPATVSFLAPAYNEERSISSTRGQSMQLIVAMNKELQQYIPGQVGRYDDGFNANCVGDTFQMLDKPTILFESGHYPSDYEREETRALIFCAMLTGVKVISNQNIADYTQKEYFEIPENGKLFYDILIENAQIIDKSLPKDSKMGILYKEKLIMGKLTFDPTVDILEKNNGFFGHLVYNCLNNSDLDKIKSDKKLVEALL